jgi:hypothetical protein
MNEMRNQTGMGLQQYYEKAPANPVDAVSYAKGRRDTLTKHIVGLRDALQKATDGFAAIIRVLAEGG